MEARLHSVSQLSIKLERVSFGGFMRRKLGSESMRTSSLRPTTLERMICKKLQALQN